MNAFGLSREEGARVIGNVFYSLHTLLAEQNGEKVKIEVKVEDKKKEVAA